MKAVLDPTWNELRTGNQFTGSSDITIMGLADLPEEDRKRYEAMGFVTKPVERRVEKQVFEEIATPPSGFTVAPRKPNEMYKLTVKEFQRMKADGKSDEEIMKIYNCSNMNLFYKWKRENGLTGVRKPGKRQLAQKKVKA
ncbi:hypothetical protein [Brevibacillus porteri]|uniref:Transposase n=1 Tax=Brevibacillus porteri TaxID=2126350 RepID=A0ABX5FFM3_9BACL|nr:hypothetical protein [Brevibacillus porteri]MED1801800.1 hypothetical protein [Brevibacillus porteri]MED2134931.1 hypothetical protein [Brevibacillus porteri]MED2748438.1 hypothetical protein [Brevibacillus porteri]MED2818362.1 hypothetical protein [Brevibacillus porteri]MED2897679.1 hypothetical protein [Brevibacillus porteri]